MQVYSISKLLFYINSNQTLADKHDVNNNKKNFWYKSKVLIKKKQLFSIKVKTKAKDIETIE